MAQVLGTYKVVLDKLVEFDSYADHKLFIKIFGKRIGEHLWGKFAHRYGYEIARLYAAMDTGGRTKLCEYLASVPN